MNNIMTMKILTLKKKKVEDWELNLRRRALVVVSSQSKWLSSFLSKIPPGVNTEHLILRKSLSWGCDLKEKYELEMNV